MVQDPASLPETPRGHSAEQLAARLSTAQKALTTALSAVVEVTADLAAIIGRPHLTTPCHVGAHEACRIFCMCENCNTPCQCGCHSQLDRTGVYLKM